MRSTVRSFSVPLKKYYRADLLASSTELAPRPRVEGWGRAARTEKVVAEAAAR